jgi:seryl-tRNA synthetase
MMHNIKSIRKNPDFFKKKFSERNFNIKLDHLLNLDKTNRNLIEKKEKSEREKKSISQKKDKKLFLKSKDLSTKIESLAEEQIKVQIEINNILMSAPNIALDDVPVGEDDKANLLVKKVGEIKKFSFLPRSHFEIGQKLNLMDFNLATKTSGTRFVFLKRDLALLERAISNFMLDIHTKDFGYQEISPPLIANESTMFGTGQLPKFESDQFEIKLDEDNIRKFLIPTAEVILTNIVRESFVNIDELPLRFVASTPCFRKEAGSYGKDTKGMIRQHQFYKVELVSIVNPENCINELNRMTECAQEILKKLKLPYRLIQLSTGDMGFSAEKTFDLEVWIPSENQYREVSSCSSCGQFQAKRMKTKFKNKKNESNFVGTLNGSGLAIGRTLIAIMENYQEKDGSITIPDVLIPYMHGKNSIR